MNAINIRKCTNKKGFTLTELIVVVVVLGLMISFAIPSYTNSIRKSHERDMILQLSVLHSSNLIYRAQQGTYWDTSGVLENDLTVINATLGINIISNDGTTYSYNSADGTAFTATATWDDFTVQVDEGPVTGTNPACSAGNCP